MLSGAESDDDLSPSNPSSNLSADRVRAALGSIRSNKGALIGATIVGVFAITSVVVFVAGLLHVQITPYNPLKQDVGPTLAGPSLAHLMGTDQLGRDVFSRIVTATPNDFSVSLIVIAFSLLVGSLIGAYAAFNGGLLDEALMRLT